MPYSLITRTATSLMLLAGAIAFGQDSQFVFDANGNLLAQTAEISSPPQILGQPQNQVVEPGETASFSVVVADPRALTFQWRFNGGDVGGATNDAFLLPNAATNNEGQYSVVLANPSGSVTSTPASLMLDADGDGLADSWELAHFTNLNQTATGDFDGDGVSNLQEFLDGTDPANSNSVRFRLLVVRDGGSVVKAPDETSYTNGETVTLTAVSSAGATFHAWTGDILTRSNSVTLVMTNDKTIYARFTPIVLVWTNPASGNWDSATNWTPALSPGSNDTVIIANSVTVTLNTPADCADVTLGGGAGTPSLAGSGTLTVRGNFLWTAGNISGSGRTVLETGSSLSVANASLLTLNSHTLENGGTALWTGSGAIILNTSVITNRAGASFEVQNAAAFGPSSGANRFDNAGTFRKSANAGTTTVPSGVSFNNYGTVQILTGTLNLNGGGTNSGSVVVSAGAAFALSGGTHTAGGSSSIVGAGQLTISSGPVTLAGLVNVSGSNTFSGGTANLTGNYICTNNTLTLSGGTTANFSGTGTVAPTVVNLITGTLGGTSAVTVNSVMNWTSGTMSGGGRTIIPAGAVLNLANPGAVTLDTRALENGGTVLWTGAGNLGVLNGAVVTNRPGALFNSQSAAALNFSGSTPCRFDNAGTFRKSANAGTMTLSSGVNFNNYGTVDIQTGVVAANGGYSSGSGALLNCALGGTNAGTGYGQLQVAGAVTLNGALSVGFTNGYLPATNDSFKVLTAGTRNGTFASFSYPSSQVTMQLSNTANSVIVLVTAVAAPPPPLLLSASLSGTNVVLTWAAISNITYRLEFNPDVTMTNWTSLPGDILGVGNATNKLDALTSSNRFYRLRVLP